MQIVPMTTTTVVVRDEVFTPEEEQTLVDFLAGYRGLTHEEAYQLDLRQWMTWCAERQVAFLGARRADIEGFGRHLELLGLAPVRRSLDGCARSRASTGTPRRRASSRSLLRCTSGDRGWTRSRTPRAWTATRSERCSSQRASAVRRNMHC